MTITPERLKIVDFSKPLARNVDEILVTGADTPRLANLFDLAGRDVYVRKSSSYSESLRELNRGSPGWAGKRSGSGLSMSTWLTRISWS